MNIRLNCVSNLKKYYGSENERCKQKVGRILGVCAQGAEVKQLLKEPFLAPHLIEKHYTLSTACMVKKKKSKQVLSVESLFVNQTHLIFLPAVQRLKSVIVCFSQMF